MGHKPRAELMRNRKGAWVVVIHGTDGQRTVAEPGKSSRVHYDHPERVPRFLKESVVPRLVDEAKLRNMRGD
jgi:hypothetical protein